MYIAGPARCRSPHRSHDQKPPVNSRQDNASGGDVWFDLEDIDLDGLLDLVVLYERGGTELGYTHWNVYRNTGTGVAETAAPYSLDVDDFDLTALRLDTLSGGVSGQRVDLNGDGHLDLVVTWDQNDETFGSEWFVYYGTATGYSGSGQSIALPMVDYPDQDPSDIVNFRWSMADWTGDEVEELVVNTYVNDSAYGSTYVYYHAWCE